MRHQPLRTKAAFTMLELIFVIVILGIVSSIGAEVIAKVYESYITQRAIHRSSVKTELTATQLANRLAYSIPGTVIGRVDNNTFNALENIPAATTDRNILEWIGYDSDSFGAIDSGAATGLSRSPVWSGYCDVLGTASKNNLSTPGSRLTDLTGIIGNLSGSTIADAAIVFPDSYNAHTLGYAETTRSTTGIHTVSGNTGNTVLTLDAIAGTRTIKEHYKLAWTAYAIVPTVVTDQVARGFQAGDNIWDLTLYYDYQPWDGENYSNGSSQILLRNVSVFNFTGTGNTIRFKICQRESIGGTFSINTCKEKAVIR